MSPSALGQRPCYYNLAFVRDYPIRVQGIVAAEGYAMMQLEVGLLVVRVHL